MSAEGKKVAIGAGLAAGLAGLVFLATRAQANPPPEDAYPDVQVAMGWHSDPEFTVGSTHSAVVTLGNPTPWDWKYIVDLLVGDQVVGSKEVSIPALGSKDASFTITFPEEGTFSVVVEVTEKSRGIFLGAFSFDPVVVLPVPPEPEIEVVGITWT